MMTYTAASTLEHRINGRGGWRSENMIEKQLFLATNFYQSNTAKFTERNNAEL